MTRDALVDAYLCVLMSNPIYLLIVLYKNDPQLEDLKQIVPWNPGFKVPIFL